MQKRLKRHHLLVHLTKHLSGACCLPLIITLLAILTSSLVQAHLDKSFDKNGGHYDNFGNYHCHNPGCSIAPSRHQFRRTSLSAPRDMELYYHEDDWPYWLSPNGSCQTSRTQVLIATSLTQVSYTNPRNCEVREGLWIDPYTGEEFTRAAQLEIDHIISPIYANAANGYQWDYATRANFANDALNLIPVSRAIYRRKRNRGIAAWRPREEFLCEYASAWTAVSNKYDLDLYGRDRSRINSIFDDCGLDSAAEIIQP